MIAPRYRKILRDLWQNLPRSLLVTLAIAIGVFGTGFVLDAYAILSRETSANYTAANPPSATLWMSNVDAAAVDAARAFPGVTDACETNSVVRARVETAPGEWKVLQLVVINDFNNLSINRVFPESGTWPPVDGQILFERGSLPMLDTTTAGKVSIRALGGPVTALTVSGSVFDPSQEPAWVNDITAGYITPGTLKLLGGQPPQTGLRIVANGAINNRASITAEANGLAEALRQRGYSVQRIEVPIPGKYPQTDKINSLLLTLALFGLLCLAMSSLMSAALVSALLSQEIRQIGIMKTLGASTRQTMGIYLAAVAILALAALAIGLPLGAAAGQSVSVGVLSLLNFNAFSNAVPLWATLLQAGIGLLIPLFTAFFPILKGSRITVREAISTNGTNMKNFGASRADQALERIRKLPRILALSLRNAFRRKGRLALALLMLALGGATFIASLASAASWNLTIDNAFQKVGYDIDIRFGGQYPVDSIENSIRAVPGVSAAEAWGYAMATSFPKYSDGTTGSATVVFAPPDETRMIAPPMVAGRWLQGGDANDMVVDTDFADNAAKQGTPVQVGDNITFSIGGRDTTWHIVGIMDKIGFQSAAYVNNSRFAAVTGQQGKAACARVSVQGHDRGLQKSVAQALEQSLGKDGFSVFIIQDLTLTRQVMVNHVVLILALLMFMSILVAAIGALGLASTVSMNVLERTREIGIMRSIGAGAGAIMRSVVLEGIITAVLSWMLAVLLSIPLTVLIAGNTGQFVFPRVMAVAYPAWPALLWLGIAVVVSAVASFFPARRAAKLTIREVLAYE